MGTTALNIVKCPGRAKQKFLEVQEPFFKKVPGRRRQKQKSESTINNFNPPTIVRVCPCLSVAKLQRVCHWNCRVRPTGTSTLPWQRDG